MKVTNIFYYIVALLGPVILFVGIIPLGNEKHPLLVFVSCIGLMAAAGFLSSIGGGPKVYKWICWSAFIGLLEALALVFLV